MKRLRIGIGNWETWGVVGIAFHVFLFGVVGMGGNEVMGEWLFKGSRYSARAGWRLFFYGISFVIAVINNFYLYGKENKIGYKDCNVDFSKK